MKPTIATLQNGLRVAVMPMPGAKTCALEVRFRGVGPAHETEAGITHALEHVLGRGSVRYPGAAVFGAVLDDLGASIDFATEPEALVLSMRVLPDRFADAAVLLSELICAPSFAEWESEREIVLAEMEDDWSDDGELVDHETRLMAELVGGSLGLPIVGAISSVQALTVEALRAHHAQHLTASNAVLSAAGPFNADAALAMITKAFSVIPSGTRTPSLEVEVPSWDVPSVVFLEGESRATITLGLIVDRFAPRTQAAWEMLFAVLSRGEASMLRQLRQRTALAYDLNANLSMFERCGLLTISTRSRQSLRSLQSILGMLTDLVTRGVSIEELAHARRLVSLDFADVQSPAEIAAEIADALAEGRAITTAEQRTALQLDISAREVTRIARQVVRPSGLAIVISGDLLAGERSEIERAVDGWRPPEVELQILIPQWGQTRAAAQ